MAQVWLAGCALIPTRPLAVPTLVWFGVSSILSSQDRTPSQEHELTPIEVFFPSFCWTLGAVVVGCEFDDCFLVGAVRRSIERNDTRTGHLGLEVVVCFRPGWLS